MIAQTYSATNNGLRGVPVTVEVEITNGMGIHLVGLADAAVKENLLRTATALQSLGYCIPDKKIIINIAPADLRKSGCGYDLPIALGILAASGQLDAGLFDPNHCRIFAAGELALDGSVRYIRGCVPKCDAIPDGTVAILPSDNGRQCPPGVICVSSLAEAVGAAASADPDRQGFHAGERKAETTADIAPPRTRPSLSTLTVQENDRRAALIAAAGGHHLLLIGGGDDKGDIARAVAALMEKPAGEDIHIRECILSVAEHDIRDASDVPCIDVPSDVTTISDLCGNNDRPGKVTLADCGVLHFINRNSPKAYTELLHATIEDSEVTIARLKGKTTWPARFKLVYDMQPCPCGQYGEGDRCVCTPNQKRAFLERALTPGLFDHIDIQAWVHSGPAVPEERREEYDRDVLEALERARQAQRKRFAGTGIHNNAQMKSREIDRYVTLDKTGKELLEKLVTTLGMSIRAYGRIMRIARTIADLEGKENILPQHITEAASFRFLDRYEFWEHL